MMLITTFGTYHYKNRGYGCCEKIYEWQILYYYQLLPCEQVLWGALVAGQEKEGELANASLAFEFHLQFPFSSPWIELSNFHQSVPSGNQREC